VPFFLRASIPGADKAIKCRIPALKLHGRAVVYLAGWKNHFSIYPLTEELASELSDDLTLYELSRGMVRFLLSEPVPRAPVERIARFIAGQSRKPAKSEP